MMNLFHQLNELFQVLISKIKYVALFVMLILLIVMICVFRSPHFFPVKVVKINGYFPSTAETSIQSVIEPVASKGFFSADIKKIQRELETLPWVQKASVTRVWPDKLVLTVNEQSAVAIWNDTSLVLPDGSVYLPTFGKLPKNLPLFTGQHGENKKILDMYKKMHDIVQPIGLNITHVRLLPDSGWEITLSNQTIVLLGNEDIQERLDRFVSIFPETFADVKKPPYLVDMRYSHGMAVKWKKTE